MKSGPEDRPTHWTTENVHRSSAFDYWQEAVCNAFVNLKVEPAEPYSGDAEGFKGEIQHRAHNALTVSRVKAGPQVVRRTPDLIAAADQEYLLMNIQVAGRGLVRQDNRCALLEAGDIAFYDSTRAYELLFDQPFEQLVVRVPLADMVDSHRLKRGTLTTAVPLRETDGLAPLIAFFAAMSDYGGDNLAECGAALMATAARTLTRDRRQPPSPEEEIRQRALAVVHARFTDSTLTLEHIAYECSVSTRTLQRAFTQHHVTLTDVLRAKRLDRAHQLLGGPRRLPVAAVAKKSGFAGERHFYRAFKAATGLSPAEYRQLKVAPEVSDVA